MKQIIWFNKFFLKKTFSIFQPLCFWVSLLSVFQCSLSYIPQNLHTSFRQKTKDLDGVFVCVFVLDRHITVININQFCTFVSVWQQIFSWEVEGIWALVDIFRVKYLPRKSHTDTYTPTGYTLFFFFFPLSKNWANCLWLEELIYWRVSAASYGPGL